MSVIPTMIAFRSSFESLFDIDFCERLSRAISLYLNVRVISQWRKLVIHTTRIISTHAAALARNNAKIRCMVCID